MSGGSPPRVPVSPEFAKRERRRARRAGLLGVGMGLFILGEAVNAMRTGQWIAFGRRFTTLILPGWAVAAIALFVLYISVAVLLRFGRKT